MLANVKGFPIRKAAQVRRATAKAGWALKAAQLAGHKVGRPRTK